MSLAACHIPDSPSAVHTADTSQPSSSRDPEISTAEKRVSPSRYGLFFITKVLLLFLLVVSAIPVSVVVVCFYCL